MKRTAEKYRIMQFGFSIFIKEDNTYQAYPFNTYLYPAENVGNQFNIEMDEDTARFHKQHNFNFKKWANEGIEYFFAGTHTENINKIKENSHGDLSEDSGTDVSDMSTSAIVKDHGKQLFDAIAKLKTKVVGHNPFFDLLFLYSHFCGPLPDTLKEFKENITEIFPEYLFE